MNEFQKSINSSQFIRICENREEPLRHCHTVSVGISDQDLGGVKQEEIDDPDRSENLRLKDSRIPFISAEAT